MGVAFCAITPCILQYCFASGVDTAAPKGESKVKMAAELESNGLQALQSRDYRRAIEDLAKALTVDPSDWDHVRSLEQTISRVGNAEIAVPILTEALATRKREDSIRFALAQCYQHLNMDNKAIAILEGPGPSANHAGLWMFTLAFSEFREGEYVRAEQRLHEGLSQEQMRPAVMFFIGNCRFGQGDIAGALDWYEPAIRLGREAKMPGLNAYYYNDGLALFRLDRFREAGAAFFEASKINESDPLAPYFLGRAQAEDGQTEDAIAIFQKLIEAHPDFTPGFYQLGMLYKRIGNTAKATEALTRVGELKRAEIQAEILLKNIRLGNGQSKYLASDRRETLPN